MLAEYGIRTRLSAADISVIFREHIKARPSGWVGFVWSRKMTWTFAPSPGEFEASGNIRDTAAATLRVVAHHRPISRIMAANDARAEQMSGVVWLDVWDAEPYRVARIRCYPGLGPKAHVELVLNQLKNSDQSAQVKRGSFAF